MLTETESNRVKSIILSIFGDDLTYKVLEYEYTFAEISAYVINLQQLLLFAEKLPDYLLTIKPINLKKLRIYFSKKVF
jgi:hypothetical protein